MNSAPEAARPGGFLQPSLPSPPASSINSPPAGYEVLPQPWSTPLKPGSSKESAFIDYVDQKLLGISRRYEKRFNADFEDESTSGIQGRGYESYGELARDLEGVIDVVWVSGTRTEGLVTLIGHRPGTEFRTSFTSSAIPSHHCVDILHLSRTLYVSPRPISSFRPDTELGTTS